jgi:phosphoglycerate dehydrogenase-like enzyme
MHVVIRAMQNPGPIVARLKELTGDPIVVAANEAELAAAVDQAELLLVPDSLYSEAIARILKERAKRLQWIQLLSAGFDAVARHGIPPGVVVTNAGGAFAPSVATHALALLLAVQKRFPVFFASQQSHAWARHEGPSCAIPFGGTVAVIGFGHIGAEIGRLLKEFGARVIAVTRTGAPHPHADETAPVARLHEILPRVDAVVIALAASPETRHLIGAPELALMKKTAILVNIARGYIVDSVALARALTSGTIGGAGLDVTDPEPLPEAHELWSAPNLLITPHMAGASGPVMPRRLAEVAGDNLARWLKGEPLAHRVSV